MRRVWWMATIAAAATGVSTPDAGRATTHAGPPLAGTITAVTVQRAAGHAELVIGLAGDIAVEDFALDAPHRIVVDLKNATLKLLPHLYDGIVRGGISNVRVAQWKPDVVRIVLDVDSEREYVVTRGTADVRVAIETTDTFEPWSLGAQPRPVVRAATKAVAPTVATLVAQQTAGRRITVSFRDTDLRDVLSIFADRTGFSIVTGVTGVRVTAEIIDQPWEVALQAILDMHGLAAFKQTSGIIKVDSYTNLRLQASNEPLAQRLIALNYARAAELAPTLAALLSSECGGVSAVQVVGAPAGGGGDAGAAGGAQQAAPQQAIPGQQNQTCAPRGKVVADVPSNSLIIYEVGSRIDSLVAFVHGFDFKTQQVNIKAKIVSVNRTTTNSLGISYDLGSSTAFFNTLAPRVSSAGAQSEFQVSLGGDAFAGVANAGRAFSATSALNLIYHTTIGNFSLTSFLDALAQEELSDIQAEPSVNTLDKRTATLFVGDNVAYLLTPPTAPGAIQAAAPQISSVNVGIQLVVTPSISANRTVRMQISAEQSSLTSVTLAGPSSSRRMATVEVLVRDGETAVIAGLTQTQTTKTRRGIPLLMSLPIIGRLFSETESIERKNDLLILITPHILDDPDPIPSGRN